MKVATIVPTPYLSSIKEDKYHMCLYQEVKSQPEYAKFYRRQRELGKFVIMDNGAAEKTNPTAEELLEVYPLVHPSEVVLPDIVYNKEETLRRTKEAYLKFVEVGLHYTTRFMAVPQGATFTEWLECMEEMLIQPHITTIGISKFVTPRYQVEMGKEANVRRECVDAVLNRAASLGRPIQIHLLGCWSNPKEIGEITRAFRGKVRGTDSAIAYVYTRNNQEYNPAVNRPDNNEIDFKQGDKINLNLFSKNKQLWTNYCRGNLEVVTNAVY